MQIYKCITLVICAVFLMSCETLSLDVKPTKDKPIQGILYVLPMTLFDITLKRYVVDCKEDSFVIANDITATAKTTEDPDNIYHIDPQSLSGDLNTGSVKVVFHDGTRFLKSINSSSTSEIGTLVASVIKAVSGIRTIKLADAPPPGAAALNGGKVLEKPTISCTGEIKNALTAYTEQEQVVGKVTKLVQEQQDILNAALLEQAETLPESVDRINENVDAQRKKLEALAVVLGTETMSLARVRKPLTFAGKKEWIPTSGDLKVGQIVTVPGKVIRAWLVGKKNGVVVPFSKTDIGELQKLLNVSVTLESPAGIGRKDNGKNDKKKTRVAWRTPHMGLYYRNPVSGTLKFEQIKGKDTNTVHEQQLPIAQLGFVHSLAVENAPFESNEFSAEFALNGALINTETKKTKSFGSGVSSILDTATDEFVKFRTAKQAQEQNAQTAELAKLTTELGILTAKQQLLEFGDDESEAELKGLNSEIAILQAKITKAQAMQQLASLQNSGL